MPQPTRARSESKDTRRALDDIYKKLADLEASIGGGGGDSLWEETSNDLHPVSEPDSFTVTTVDGNGGDISLTSGGDVNMETTDGGWITMALSPGGRLFISGLPTVSPGFTGRVWNDGGTLKIT